MVPSKKSVKVMITTGLVTILITIYDVFLLGPQLKTTVIWKMRQFIIIWLGYRPLANVPI